MMCSAKITIQKLIFLLWITSALTSFVNSAVETDSPPTEFTTKVNSFNGSSKSDHQSSDLKPPVSSSFVGEGGPITVSSTTSSIIHATVQQLNASDISNSSRITLKNESNDYNVGRNNTSKIVPRKGADISSVTFHENESVVNVSGVTEENHMITASPSTVQPNLTITMRPNATTENSTLLHQNATSNSKMNMHVVKHKPKPTATIGSNDMDAPMPVFSSKGSFFGMSKKMDYILPVVVTLVILPLLIAVSYVVYRKGRDCWDKRHYRRMDFLIDGMYND